jgi:sulfur carrier protein
MASQSKNAGLGVFRVTLIAGGRATGHVRTRRVNYHYSASSGASGSEACTTASDHGASDLGTRRIEGPMELIVNGQSLTVAERAVPGALLLGELLQELRAEGRIAVEVNGDIVPRSQHLATPLAPGDRVEIIRAVGGG